MQLHDRVLPMKSNAAFVCILSPLVPTEDRGNEKTRRLVSGRLPIRILLLAVVLSYGAACRWGAVPSTPGARSEGGEDAGASPLADLPAETKKNLIRGR